MRLLPLIIASLLLVSCSADIVKEKAQPGNDMTRADSTSKAMDHFINGQILDVEERYEDALKEFGQAATYDKSGGIYYALALDYYRLNKFALAKQSAVKAIAKDTANREYEYLLASIYEGGKAPDSAAVCYEKILKEDSLDLRANFSLANIYKTSKPNKALEIYNRLLSITGPTPEVLFEIAGVNERLGNTDATINTIEDLLKLNPSDEMLKKVLIETCIKAKKYDKALSLIDEELKAYPEDQSLLGYKGGILAEQGKWDAAKNVYLAMMKNPAMDHATKVKIGLALMAQSAADSTASDAALAVFSAADKDTADWRVKLYLAEINLARKNDSLAVKYYGEASKLADWNVDIWTQYGGLLFDSGKYKLLNEEMGKAIQIFPDNFAINMLYGLSYAQLEEHKEAKPLLIKAVTINPGDVMALSALGYTLNQLKEDDEALKYLNRALDIDPNNMQVLGMAGLIYENKKNYDQSDKLYQKALKVDSTDAQILNNYAYSLSERGTDLDKALNMAKIAVEKEPKNSSYLDTMGWIYYKLGDYGKAAKYIEDAIECGEKSVTLYEHLGDVYVKLNKKEKALFNWKKALLIEPGNEKLKLKIEKDSK